jgi:hypothetical protein
VISEENLTNTDNKPPNIRMQLTALRAAADTAR